MLQPQDDVAGDTNRERAGMPVEPLNTTPSDSTLIAQICKGQEHALGLLYDRYNRLLFTIALRVTGDRSIAEEVIQDVFHAVWKSAGGFQLDGNAKAWLFSITRHRAIDATRARNFRGHTRDVAFDAIQSIEHSETTDGQVFAHLEAEQVRCALAAIPTMQRQVIELAYYGGLTCAAIANQLGQPVGTVKTRIRLGLQKLRELLHNVEV